MVDPAFDFDLPNIGERNWGDEVNTALSNIPTGIGAEEGDLKFLLKSGVEVNVGPLPPGPAGAPGGSDAATAEWIETGPETTAALSTKIGEAIAASTPRGFGLSRVATKVLTGVNVTVSYLGDSGLEGNTVTTAGNDAASRFKTWLDTTYGIVSVKSNRAVSGYRAYSPMDPSQATPTKFSQALTDRADLYVIAFGHNDIRSGPSLGAAFRPGTGYALTQHLRALEHMIRRIRLDVADADILVSNEWPYTGTAVASNTDLLVYGKAAQRLAISYGCAFADYYGALVALGADGSTPAIDDLYITNQHPNDEGHRVWAETLEALIPLPGADVAAQAPATTLPTPLFGAERYTHTGWVQMPAAAGGVRTAGTDGYRLVGSWATQGTLPQTSTTAGDYVEIQVIGSELAIRLDNTTGTVKIEVDAATVVASLNLAAQGGVQNYHVVDLGTPGIHRVKVTVLTGTVTFRGCSYLPALGARIPHTSALVAFSGFGSSTTSADYYEGSFKGSSASGTTDTVTVEWVGTALYCNGYQYGSTSNSRGVATDGGTEVVTDFGVAGGASQPAGWLVTSGLPYGRHTTVIRQAQTGRALQVSSFLAFDERRIERPQTLRGLSVVGESPAFHVALPGRPVVRLNPDDATSAAPPYATTVTAGGFTANGTAAARVQYEADTGRVAY